jgi:hypothetical protein
MIGKQALKQLCNGSSSGSAPQNGERITWPPMDQSSIFDGSRPPVQFEHSLMPVQPNCPGENELGSWASPGGQQRSEGGL